MTHRILVVDDDRQIVRLVQSYLQQSGFTVLAAYDGEEALHAIRREKPDLVVLDLNLPKRDGLDVARIVRSDETLAAIPILMLTARVEDVDKLIGLELGADDYLTKPFNPRELVARVKAILRRSTAPRGTRDEASPLHVGDVTIDPARREVTVAGRPASLRTKEFDLLRTLAENRGLVLSREQLLNLVWGFDFYGQTRTVDVHVAHLRKILTGSRVSIETVTGVGYKLVAAS